MLKAYYGEILVFSIMYKTHKTPVLSGKESLLGISDAQTDGGDSAFVLSTFSVVSFN